MSPVNHRGLHQGCDYKELLRLKKAAYRKKVPDSLHNVGTNSTEFWGKLKFYIGKKSESTTITKKEWFDHFSRVFNCNTSKNGETDDLEDGGGEDYETRIAGDELEVTGDVHLESLESDITDAEVYTAVRALKNGKAAGRNGIIGEFFKHSATFVVPFLVKFFNRLFTTGSFPQDWLKQLFTCCIKR